VAHAAIFPLELYTTAGEKKGREAILHFEQVRDFFVGSHRLSDSAARVPVPHRRDPIGQRISAIRFNASASAFLSGKAT
jgi:hypothetical protein